MRVRANRPTPLSPDPATVPHPGTAHPDILRSWSNRHHLGLRRWRYFARWRHFRRDFRLWRGIRWRCYHRRGRWRQRRGRLIMHINHATLNTTGQQHCRGDRCQNQKQLFSFYKQLVNKQLLNYHQFDAVAQDLFHFLETIKDSSPPIISEWNPSFTRVTTPSQRGSPESARTLPQFARCCLPALLLYAFLNQN